MSAPSFVQSGKQYSKEELAWRAAFNALIARFGKHLYNLQANDEEKGYCSASMLWKCCPILPGKGLLLSFQSEIVGKIMINHAKAVNNHEVDKVHVIFRNMFDPKDIQQSFQSFHGLKNHLPCEWENLLSTGFSNIYAFINDPTSRSSSNQSCVQYFELKSNLAVVHNEKEYSMSRKSHTITMDTNLQGCPADLPSFMQLLVDHWLSKNGTIHVKNQKYPLRNVKEKTINPFPDTESLLCFVFPILGNTDVKVVMDNIYHSLLDHLIFKPSMMTNNVCIPQYQSYPVYDQYLNQKVELIISRDYTEQLQVYVAPGFLYQSLPTLKTTEASEYTYRLGIVLPPTLFDLIHSSISLSPSCCPQKEFSIFLGSVLIVKMEYEYHTQHFQTAYDTAYPQFIQRCIQHGTKDKQALLEHHQYFLSLLLQQNMIITHEVCKYLFYDLLEWLVFDHTTTSSSGPMTGQEPSVITRAILDYVSYYSACPGKSKTSPVFTRLLSELEKRSSASTSGTPEEDSSSPRDDSCIFIQEFITTMLFGHYWILPQEEDRITLHTIRHYYTTSYAIQEIRSIVFMQEYFLPSIYLYATPYVHCISQDREGVEDRYDLRCLFHQNKCFVSTIILHDFFLQECQLGEEHTQYHTNCQKISHWSAWMNTSWEKQKHHNQNTAAGIGNKLPSNIQWNCELLWEKLLHWNTVSSFFCPDAGIVSSTLDALMHHPDSSSSSSSSSPAHSFTKQKVKEKENDATKTLRVFVFDLPRKIFLRAKDAKSIVTPPHTTSSTSASSAVDGMNAILDEMIIYPADGYLILSYSFAQLLESNPSMIFPFIFRLAFQNTSLMQDCLMEVLLRELMSIPKGGDSRDEEETFFAASSSKKASNGNMEKEKEQQGHTKDLTATMTAYHNLLQEEEFQAAIERLLCDTSKTEKKEKVSSEEEEGYWEVDSELATIASPLLTSSPSRKVVKEDEGGLEEMDVFDILQDAFLDTPIFSPLLSPFPPSPPTSTTTTASSTKTNSTTMSSSTKKKDTAVSGPTIISTNKPIPKRSKPLLPLRHATTSSSTTSSSSTSSSSTSSSSSSGISWSGCSTGSLKSVSTTSQGNISDKSIGSRRKRKIGGEEEDTINAVKNPTQEIVSTPKELLLKKWLCVV